jgi:tRNA(fMet)-specific endonuclease VapC
MSNYLVDTNILIGYLRNNQFCVNKFNDILRFNNIFISPISRLEILNGLRTGEEKKTFELINNICYNLKISNFTFEESENIIMELRKRGITIDIADAVIAASAIGNKLPLITLNQKHFLDIPDLKLFTLF